MSFLETGFSQPKTSVKSHSLPGDSLHLMNNQWSVLKTWLPCHVVELDSSEGTSQLQGCFQLQLDLCCDLKAIQLLSLLSLVYFSALKVVIPLALLKINPGNFHMPQMQPRKKKICNSQYIS